MKKYISFLSSIAIAVGISGCSDFLEVMPKGKVTTPSFLSSPDGLKGALVGTYSKLYAVYDGDFLRYPDVAGNMLSIVNASESSSMISQYNFTSNEDEELGAVGKIWTSVFEAMANANNIIQYEPEVVAQYPLQASECERILGEALYIRALCHLDVCLCYAQPYNYTPDASHLGVPVLYKTPGPDDNESRKSVAEVYTLICDDLARAEQLLADKTPRGQYYVSLDAVRALHSRVSLYMEKWQEAIDYAESAISGKTLSTGQAYSDMYRNPIADSEVIFRFDGTDMGSKHRTFYSDTAIPADTLLTLFDEGDIRTQVLHKDGARYCMKYEPDLNRVGIDHGDEPIVSRLSELYLNAAEAACMLSDYTAARGYIKPILERAIDTQYADDVLAATSDAQLLDLVRKERVKELCFEGHNFFDIVRWKMDLVREKGTTSVVKRIDYPSDYFVLPISRYELNANLNMQPNPTVNK
ncbi:MAG: RagB/SusD family nutrient uptake outer membrane protein [Lachnospiraceae bacterium]|nr:RagB/SusD family nutrient uptake outer membrane protein [Lachnospiraceae bacterium]